MQDEVDRLNKNVKGASDASDTAKELRKRCEDLKFKLEYAKDEAESREQDLTHRLAKAVEDMKKAKDKNGS